MNDRPLRSVLAASACALLLGGGAGADAPAARAAGSVAGSIAGSVARPVEIAGVEFPARRTVGDVELGLRSVGLLRWLFFNGYAAALYMGGDALPSAALTDVPKRLELHYFRAIPATAVADAAQQILVRNFDAPTLAAVQARVDQIGRLYVDISPGDRYALSYLPGVGTALEYNGKQLGVIPGADFAAAYFAIWLGAEPLDAALRDQLLSAR